MKWFSSVQFSRSVVSDSLRPHGLQHARPPCPSPTPGACSNSCPSSQRCHATHLILCRPLLLCLQSFPASGSFPISDKTIKMTMLYNRIGLPRWLRWYRICLQCKRPGFNRRAGKISWRRVWQLTPVFLPGEFHGQRSLMGCTVNGVAKSQA